MELVVLLLAAYGMTFGLMQEKAPFLNRFLFGLPAVGGFFERMFECAYCTGFNCGLFIKVIWLLVGVPRAELTMNPALQVIGTLLFAFASSAFCYIMETLLTRLER